MVQSAQIVNSHSRVRVRRGETLHPPERANSRAFRATRRSKIAALFPLGHAGHTETPSSRPSREQSRLHREAAVDQ